MRAWLLLAIVGCASPKDVAHTPDAPAGTPADAAASNDDAPPTAATCDSKQAQPRDATWTVAGRAVRVHVPASYDPSKPTPVVLNLHGWSYDGASHAAVSRFIPVSDAHGFIAIHPDGTGSPRGWNAGDCCNANGPDEVVFFEALLDELESKLCVDQRRVFAMGLSNGGFLSHLLACRMADRIAAIAGVAGVLGVDDCQPSRPVPVLQVHGTDDQVIPYNGGGINGSKSVAETISSWASYNGCAAASTQTYANGDATCVRRSGCAAGADVELCTIDDGGHQWPGGESIGSFYGKKSDAISASEAAWAFFAAHPRP